MVMWRLKHRSGMGNRHRLPAASLLFGILLADGNFDSDHLRALLALLGADVVVPPKFNRVGTVDCDVVNAPLARWLRT